LKIGARILGIEIEARILGIEIEAHIHNFDATGPTEDEIGFRNVSYSLR
jgi:hypothetical protein